MKVQRDRVGELIRIQRALHSRPLDIGLVLAIELLHRDGRTPACFERTP